jgi:integrase
MPRKEQPEGTRAANGEGTVYLGSDGYWHGRVTVGTKDDGSPDRRHIKRKASNPKAEDEIIKAVNKLIAARTAGEVRKAGKPPLAAAWWTHWVEDIAAPTLKYTAARAYRTAVYKHLIPGLGKHRYDRLEPEHYEKLYKKMIAGGAKPATVHQVHRTAVTAGNAAVKRRVVGWNPAAIAEHPRVEQEEVKPYEVEEVQLLIETALKRRNGVRFVIALALGNRQGEALGIKWERLDRKTKTLRFPKQLQRHVWQHGCDQPYQCAERWHKLKPCPPGCKHKQCPPVCAPDCSRHSQYCPQRRDGGLVEVDVKSLAGKRALVLPDTLYELIFQHEKTQQAEREHAGTLWEEGGWMFTTPTGRPIDPRRDMEDWKALLAAAGLRDARLHDARHTAATVLLVLGVPGRTVMYFMGWSEDEMLLRYQHIIDRVGRSVAEGIEGLLFKTN